MMKNSELWCISEWLHNFSRGLLIVWFPLSSVLSLFFCTTCVLIWHWSPACLASADSTCALSLLTPCFFTNALFLMPLSCALAHMYYACEYTTLIYAYSPLSFPLCTYPAVFTESGALFICLPLWSIFIFFLFDIQFCSSILTKTLG